ncbi:GntR family transcriptional regulator [Streptomyces mashuensis]|nr:GntR family transcriptional regulator [Streptomyces mashuensis]
MPTAPAVRTPRPAAADRAYAHVKEAVLHRRYAGGTLLTEGDVAQAVGVSRTPVREALLRLEGEGLLKLYPKKGALVLAVDAQEIADVVETRLLVEKHAAGKAVPASPALIARLEEHVETMRRQAEAGDLAAVSDSDRAFHAEIVRNAGNRILAGLYEQLRDRQLRMGVAVLHAHPDRIARSIAEHTEILEALRSGDAGAATAAVDRHIHRFSNLARGDIR